MRRAFREFHAGFRKTDNGLEQEAFFGAWSRIGERLLGPAAAA
ncbi:hypothetical protein PAMC26510_18450 [Caballeronia sordidicola]|uniref:Uncharacterized protein n=1 Tax=Caballeronia sordidicola TaxID=196367 RepID=A0A242MPT0_CABSO|nr:hypothetical protein PAMC26510_18450 [Caballeronia sordidicola]